MKKSFKLENLDCANCASKMESAIGKLDCVSSAKISFMTERLVLEADDIELAITEAQKIISKIEKDCRIKV